MNKLAILLIIVATVFAMGCKKLPEFTSGNGNGGGTPVTPVAVTPDIHTYEAIEISDQHALLQGVVTNFSGFNEENLTVGFCWNTTGEPVINDDYFIFGFNPTNEGRFEFPVNDLTAGTTYCVRALAYLNSNPDEVYYGEEIRFKTTGGVELSVNTEAATEITSTSAVLNGSIANYDASISYEYGFLWGQETMTNVIVSENLNQGAFSVTITGLAPNTTYSYRARAIISGAVSTDEVLGEVVWFTTSSGGSGGTPEGAINGLFTINSNGNQVYFSKGNLQYQASTNIWRFAENQWDFVGDENSNISSSYSGWIDLFGWGTSGYNHGAVCYQPWSTSTAYSDYLVYGSASYSLFDQTGQADWGYNAISNGGNVLNAWRTLKHEEWECVLYTRNTLSGIRYAKAQINGITGLILLPDDWSNSYYSLNSTNTSSASFNSNVIDLTTWANSLEAHGAIFLPTAGTRENTTYGGAGTYGTYWTSSQCDHYSAWLYGINNETIETGIHRSHGRSVRLVHDAGN